MRNLAMSPTRQDALRQAQREPGTRGICAQCGCTQFNPCLLGGYEPCSWANKEQTLCSNPYCREKAAPALKIPREGTVS